MGPNRVVVRGVRLQHTAQVRLTKHHPVVETFAPNRADEALNVTVLPGRTRGGRMIANPDPPNAGV